MSVLFTATMFITVNANFCITWVGFEIKTKQTCIILLNGRSPEVG